MISATLTSESIWTSCQPFMEMIATRTPKPLFPRIGFNFFGLEEHQKYLVKVSIERVDDERYTFKNDKWTTEGFRFNTKLWQDPKFVSSDWILGEQLLNDGISFPYLKISNTPSSLPNVFHVNTHHKYMPVLTIFSESNSIRVPFLNATFIPVTVYKNPKVSCAKSKLNKFSTKGAKRKADRQMDEIVKKQKMATEAPTFSTETMTTVTPTVIQATPTPSFYHHSTSYSTLSGYTGFSGISSYPPIPVSSGIPDSFSYSSASYSNPPYLPVSPFSYQQYPQNYVVPTKLNYPAFLSNYPFRH